MFPSSYAFIKAALFEEAQHQDILRNLTLRLACFFTTLSSSPRHLHCIHYPTVTVNALSLNYHTLSYIYHPHINQYSLLLHH